MKKSNESPNPNCEDIEQLLVNRILDELTRDENFVVEEHLKSCEHCQTYQQILLNLKNSMQIDAKETLIPDPAIRENILRQMKTLNPQETGFFKVTWQYIRNIFKYRIPVYQALSGLALIALIFLIVNQLSFSPSQKP
jgi:Tfp pilus assembly pilus retraction ATPase PilT